MRRAELARSGCRATRCRRWSPSTCSPGRRCGRCRAPTRHATRGQARAGRARAPATRGATQAVRCRWHAGTTAGTPTPTGPQGSHVLTSMLGADALALIAPGEGELRRPGEPRGDELLRVRERDPRRVIGRRRAGPRAREDRRRARVGGAAGRQRDHQAGRRGHPPARGARPDLEPGVPGAPGAHLLALPDPRLAGPAARGLHAEVARDRVSRAAVRAAALPRARVRDRGRLRHGDLADQEGAAGGARRPRARASCGSPSSARPRRRRRASWSPHA